MFQPQPTPFYPFSSYGPPPVSSVPQLAQFHPAGPGDSVAPTMFADPIFTPTPVASDAGLSFHFHNTNNNTNPNNLPPRYKMSGQGVSDLEAQEELARNFQPDLQGPLVGEKKSSLAIAEEYAKADPIYVAKTTALPQKYSHYRPILGDGNCGWRAAGFSYFETLLRLGNQAQLEEEVARMISLNNFLTTVGGFEDWLFEDMVEETTSLLKDLAELMPTSPQAAADLLRQRFNDPNVSNAIVYHLRLLASSWLKGSVATYQGFIPDNLGVDGYRKNWLEPVDQEIDHLGMTLLIDVLLKPIGFSVEIVYLDRSEGTQVNSHIIQAQDSNGAPTNPGGPVIHLLYRPSHYDILYKDRPPIPLQAVAEMTRNPNIQVHRATNFTQHPSSIQSTPMGQFSQLDLNTLLSIPGFGLPSQPSHQGYASQYQSPIEQGYAASPISSISPISPGASSATTPSSTVLQPAFSAPPPPPASSSLTSPKLATPIATFPQSTTLPVHSHLPPPQRPTLTTHQLLAGDVPSPSSAGSYFRPSKYEWEAAADRAQEGPVQFLTSTFKNSHYNTAHYNNPNFQPEEWNPDGEEQITSRKRSS
ncbi:Cysteine proteinase [Venustampulla echinocandica]|uniref:ubiquitinyl hydrolase 1 n=1 Tax=Venustampulla echinocandica TaxID=2656787 RepID=A0A370TKS6_9HELO|nr:Cysteine proteinase [Venustampulla echinocandica]RDL36119.1 Cysteine proteinase [Venustampulla echinocandica]